MRLETRGVLLVQVGPEEGAAALVRAAAPLAFVPVPSRVPPGYPVRPHEVLRVAWTRAGVWHALALSDLSRLFAVGLNLSRQLPGTVLAVRRDLYGAMVLKAYRGGRPVFKLGDDPDHEVPWPVLAANPEDLRALLTAHDVRDRAEIDAVVGRLQAGGPGFPAELLARLGVVLVLPTVGELLGHPGVRVQELVDERSPLNR